MIIDKKYNRFINYIKLYEQHGIEIDVGVRWEKGTEHHHKSKEIMEHLQEIDFVLCNDYFCWKFGGDGDNGEILMYQLDMYFELQDKLKEQV